MPHAFDEAGFTAFAAAMRDRVAATYQAARDHKDQIQAYDITVGWP